MEDRIQEPRSGQKIAVNDGWALRYWTRELGVTERDLRETVEVVGPYVEDVRKMLTRAVP